MCSECRHRCLPCCYGNVEGHFPGSGEEGESGKEGHTYMCEYRLILNMADPTGFFKIGLFCSDKYYYVIHSFDLLLFWFIELREYY